MQQTASWPAVWAVRHLGLWLLLLVLLCCRHTSSAAGENQHLQFFFSIFSYNHKIKKKNTEFTSSSRSLFSLFYLALSSAKALLAHVSLFFLSVYQSIVILFWSLSVPVSELSWNNTHTARPLPLEHFLGPKEKRASPLYIITCTATDIPKASRCCLFMYRYTTVTPLFSLLSAVGTFSSRRYSVKWVIFNPPADKLSAKSELELVEAWTPRTMKIWIYHATLCRGERERIGNK